MIKVGIFFGGRSREREVSFAGGRTVYDNLNKSIFEPVPIFVDSFGNLVLLDWEYIYKGSIRDFYPHPDFLKNNKRNIQIYAESLGEIDESIQDDLINKIGRKVAIDELKSLMNFAFLALHGNYGEDGSIQGILDYLGIPFSGSGILPSAIGMDKAFQKEIFANKSYGKTRFTIISREDWENGDQKAIYQSVVDQVGIPMVSRPANQGSSIGVGMMMEDDFNKFSENIQKALFIETIKEADWQALSAEEKEEWLKNLCDLRSDIGLPVRIGEETIYHPDALFDFIEMHFTKTKENLSIQAIDNEREVLLEEFIDGKEFSCIVMKTENGEIISLPPTGILKGTEIFDYRSKYLPGMVRKVTPIDLPNDQIQEIRKECVELFKFMRFDVYARIDGFIREDGSIVLNDPNTTSGMLPSSFFFHQAAEIGLNPSQFLTFLIRQSIQDRIESIRSNPKNMGLLNHLDEQIELFKNDSGKQLRIAIIMGGYSSERHISVESGRNIYEKLASSEKYEPIPIFLSGSSESYKMHQIPINLLLKDNADDISDKIYHFKKHDLVEEIKSECRLVTDKYANAETSLDQPILLDFDDLKAKADFVFIALHGRPGEDGDLQQKLEQMGLPYNGSPVHSSQITIDKYRTNQLLKSEGFIISDQLVVKKEDWLKSAEEFHQKISNFRNFPVIAKPIDDGCSSAVKLIKNQEQLKSFSQLIFRDKEELDSRACEVLGLKLNEIFPQKTCYLVEEYTQKKNAVHFLEITGGLLSKMDGNSMVYEVFEPSEVLASNEVLSLEEKFLAGEGQNLTPARFAKTPEENQRISKLVRADLLKAAKILGIEGYTRIDAFVRVFESGIVETIVIEANSLPGMTPATAIFHQAAINGYKPYEFIDAIINYGMNQVSKVV